MTTEQQPTPVTIAAAPYDDLDADVVLRSADRVHFYVYKAVLSLASPVFKDMFRLPQPRSNLTDEAEKPIISVTEDHKTLEILLKFCYPAMDTTLQSFDDIAAALTTMNKYDMETGLERVRKQLISPPFIEEPHRVFALAYRFKLKQEAILAVKESVRHPLRVPYYPELEYIPTSAYHLYFTYRILCGERVADLIHWKRTCYRDLWDTLRQSFNCTQICASAKNNSWLAESAQELTAALAARPCAQTAADPKWYQSRAWSCQSCSRKAHHSMTEFVRKTLVPRINETLAQVPLDIDI